MFGRKYGIMGPFMTENIPHAISNQTLPLKCTQLLYRPKVYANFGFGFGIGPKPKFRLEKPADFGIILMEKCFKF